MRRFRPTGSPAPLRLMAGISLGVAAMLLLVGLTSHSGGTFASISTVVFASGGSNMTVATEIVTHLIAFVLFVWIMKKLAWAPLLKVIDERRDKIESDFAKAEELQKEADETKAKFEAQLKEIEEKARAEMQKAIDEGKRISQEIQAKAREDAEALLERAKQNAEIELANARKQLRKDVVELTLAATEKVLRENIDRAAHQRHIDKYIDDLGGLQ